MTDLSRAGDRVHRTGHILVIHHSDGERMRHVADWFEAGLAIGAKVLYADVAGWGAECLVDALDRRGMRADRAVDDKRLEFIGLEDALALGAANGVVQRSLGDERFTGVRLSVRCDAVARSVTPERYLAFERDVDSLCGTTPLSVLCQYDDRAGTSAELDLELALHTSRVYEGDVCLQRRGSLIEVDGLLDSLDGDVLAGSLRRMTAELPVERGLCLDLRQVEGATIGACQALVDGTEPFRRRGGEVRCDVHPGQTARMLTTVIARDVPGFALVVADGGSGGVRSRVTGPGARLGG